MIEQLRAAGVPVLWVVKEIISSNGIQRVSRTDLLKYLVLQLLRINPGLRSESKMALSCVRIQSATSEEEWFRILGSLLAGLGKVVYIFIDLEMVAMARGETTTRSN
jgi:hypothetical protein